MSSPRVGNPRVGVSASCPVIAVLSTARSPCTFRRTETGSAREIRHRCAGNTRDRADAFQPADDTDECSDTCEETTSTGRHRRTLSAVPLSHVLRLSIILVRSLLCCSQCRPALRWCRVALRASMRTEQTWSVHGEHAVSCERKCCDSVGTFDVLDCYDVVRANYNYSVCRRLRSSETEFSHAAV